MANNIDEIRKDYKENKKEWDEMLDEGTKRKYDACTDKKTGKFDYLKMSEMVHSGQW